MSSDRADGVSNQLRCRAIRVLQLRRLASAASIRFRRPFSRTPSSTRSSSCRSMATSRSISFSMKAGMSLPSRQWRSQSSASTQSYLGRGQDGDGGMEEVKQVVRVEAVDGAGGREER